MRRPLIALVAPVLAVSLLAGCGGGSSDEAGSSPSASESSTSGGESPGESPGQPGEPGETPSQPGEAAEDAPGAGTEYCQLLKTDFAALFATITGPEDVEKAVDIIEQIAESAPPEVSDEWGQMKGALGQMQGAMVRAAELQQLATSGEIPPKQLRKQTERLRKDMVGLNTPANAKAGEAVSAHATRFCGVSLG